MNGISYLAGRGKPLEKFRAAVVLALALALVSGVPAAGQGRAEGPQIVVTGRGEVTAAPDIATLRLGVESRAEMAAAALEAARDGMDAVLSALAGAGVAEADIRTTDLSLDPIFAEASRPGAEGEVTGYVATNLAHVRIRRIDRVGEFIDAAAAAGANSFRGLDFDLADPSMALDEARSGAVADAARRARVLAEAAGVSLGPIRSITEGGGPVRGAATALAREAGIAPGELTLSAEVTIVYDISP